MSESFIQSNRRGLIWGVFLIYLLILVKLTLFKYPMGYIEEVYKYFNVGVLKYSMLRAQLVPFKTIRYYLFDETKLTVSIANLVGNIIMFFPAPVLLHILFPKWVKNLATATFSSLLLSLCFELLQVITYLGQFDIDDLLLNTVGGMLGFIIFSAWRKYYRPLKK